MQREPTLEIDHTGSTVNSPVTGRTYTLRRRLSSGGYGSVFKGFSDNGDSVAVKAFHLADRDPEQVRRWWAAETDLLVRLDHPYIVSVQDSFREDDNYYIVLELALSSLSDFISSNVRFPMEHVIQSAYRLLHALDFVHRKNLMHRDLTPHNVLYFSGGLVKMSDFGLSKELPSGEEMARTLVFNRPFVVPELIERGYSTIQSDLYQLGLVIYSMLTGQYAIPPHTEWEQVKKMVADGVPVNLAHELPRYGIPMGLSFMVMELVRVDLDARYKSAREVLSDLVRLATDLQIHLDYPPEGGFLPAPNEPMPWEPELFRPEKFIV